MGKHCEVLDERSLAEGSLVRIGCSFINDDTVVCSFLNEDKGDDGRIHKSLQTTVLETFVNPPGPFGSTDNVRKI